MQIHIINLIISQRQVRLFTISGMVTNINKHPIARTKIMLKSLSNKDFYLHTQSIENGTFQWHDVPEANDYMISAYPPENDPHAVYQSESFAVTRNCQIDIMLEPSLTISGTIRAYDMNAPIQNARVNLYAENVQAETWSDADGAYLFKKIENASNYVIVVQHDDFATVKKSSVAAGEIIDFILKKDIKLCGQVNDKVTGQGIPNVPVEIYSNARKDIDGYYGAIVSDDSGRFCIQGLMPTDAMGNSVDDYLATALAPGFPPFSISIPDLNRPANFYLFKGKENEISGIIQIGSTYDCFIDIVDTEYGFQVTLPASPDGSFVLDGLSPDRYYQLIFLAFEKETDNQIFKQWAQFDSESGFDIGTDQTLATHYQTGDVLNF